MKRLHLKIHGRVQGVFFRGLCADEAQRLGLVGSVSNCADGCVEVVAEGDEESLKKLREWCKVGPPLAWVERVEERWDTTTTSNVNTFEIR